MLSHHHHPLRPQQHQRARRLVFNKHRTLLTVCIVLIIVTYSFYNRGKATTSTTTTTSTTPSADDDEDDDNAPRTKSVEWWTPPLYEGSPRLPNQEKRGLHAVHEQLVKPIQCPPNVRPTHPRSSSSSLKTSNEHASSSIAFNREKNDDDPELDLTPESRLRRYLFSSSPGFRAEKERDLKAAISACNSGVPMMATQEYELLFGLLRKGDAMLEWGSGRSSCIWAHAVGELHSVEDSSGWAGELWSKRLRGNQMVHWMPSAEPAAQPDRPPSSYEGYSGYIRFPLEVAAACPGISRFGGKFEVVLVDGRARPQCAHFARLRLLAPGGLLMIHDWEIPGREYYRIVLRWFDLLHVEHSLAIFKAKTGGVSEDLASRGPGFPQWWTRNMDVRKWNSRRPSMVPYKEPFEEITVPSEQDMKRVLATFVA